MKKPKVSVIMAAYNHEKYVGDAIESVIGQTYKNWEMLIIDDCSTDRTREVIGGIVDARISFCFHDKNEGPVKTFNELLAKAEGENIAIIGSDDLWYKNKLEEQIRFMEKNQKYAVAFSYVDIMDENGQIYVSKDTCDVKMDFFNQKNRTNGEIFRVFFERGNYFCHPSSIIRKRVIREIGEFDYRFRQLHDYYYWIKILNKYPVYILPQKLIKYRRCSVDNRSVSAATYENSVRLINESQEITYEMIRDMSVSLFKEAFCDMIIRDIESEEELVCEKYFILKKWQVWGNNNLYPARWYLAVHINNEKIRKCLEEKFAYHWLDFYADKAKVFNMYPLDFYEKYVELRQNYETSQEIIQHKLEEQKLQQNEIYKLTNELEIMRNTVSWRITKPLRKMSQLRKKNEH